MDVNWLCVMKLTRVDVNNYSMLPKCHSPFTHNRSQGTIIRFKWLIARCNTTPPESKHVSLVAIDTFIDKHIHVLNISGPLQGEIVRPHRTIESIYSLLFCDNLIYLPYAHPSYTFLLVLFIINVFSSWMFLK